MGAIYACVLLLYCIVSTQTNVYTKFIEHSLNGDHIFYHALCTLVGVVVYVSVNIYNAFTRLIGAYAVYLDNTSTQTLFDSGSLVLRRIGIVEKSFYKFVAGPVAVFLCLMVAFHTYGLIQQYFDTHDGPWSQYKRHRTDTLTYWDMLPVVLRNQGQLLLVMLIGHSSGHVFHIPAESASTLEILCGITISGLVYETIFHFTHWILHVPALYPYHKLHHITFGSVGISGMYQGHIDYFLTTSLAHVTGPLLFTTYIPVQSLYILALIGGCNSIHSHGAYDFPGMPPPTEHSLHHLLYNVNFGTGLWDAVCGTGYNPQNIDLSQVRSTKVD